MVSEVVLHRYPVWGECPEPGCSADRNLASPPEAVTYYRGFLVHFWGGASGYCVTPYGDLAGVPTLLPFEEYAGHHYTRDYMTLHSREGQQDSYYIAPTVDPVDWTRLNLKIALRLVDTKWRPADEYLCELRGDAYVPPDHSNPTLP